MTFDPLGSGAALGVFRDPTAKGIHPILSDESCPSDLG